MQDLRAGVSGARVEEWTPKGYSIRNRNQFDVRVSISLSRCVLHSEGLSVRLSRPEDVSRAGEEDLLPLTQSNDDREQLSAFGVGPIPGRHCRPKPHLFRIPHATNS